MQFLYKLSKFIAKRPKKVFFTELMIGIILLSMPSWFLLIDSIPTEIPKFETKLITVDSDKFGFYDINAMYWLSLLKLIPIVSLSIWFFTCKYWWRFALLIPLIFSLTQFINLFMAERYFDNGEFWIAFMLALPIIIIFIWIDNRIEGYRSNILMKENINSEVGYLIIQISLNNPNQNLNEYYHRLEKIRRNKAFMNEEKYLYEIIALKNQLIVSTKLSNQ